MCNPVSRPREWHTPTTQHTTTTTTTTITNAYTAIAHCASTATQRFSNTLAEFSHRMARGCTTPRARFCTLYPLYNTRHPSKCPSRKPVNHTRAYDRAGREVYENCAAAAAARSWWWLLFHCLTIDKKQHTFTHTRPRHKHTRSAQRVVRPHTTPPAFCCGEKVWERRKRFWMESSVRTWQRDGGERG